jgi:hypothetical protein
MNSIQVLENLDLTGTSLVRCVIHDNSKCIVDSRYWSNSTKSVYNVIGPNMVDKYTLLRKVNPKDDSNHLCRINDQLVISFNGVSNNEFYRELMFISYNMKFKIKLKIKINNNTILEVSQDFRD